MLLGFVFLWLGLAPLQQDTVQMDAVEIYGQNLERFSKGMKVSAVDDRDLENYQSRSLGDLLQETTPIFIRQYGAGMLASPSVRGTSAGHTAVFWNGLPINSPSLGQSDLSILPVQAFDQAQVQYGSNGSFLGNETIGGSILLQSKADFDKGFKAGINTSVGSFGLFNLGLTAGYSNEKVSFKTKIYNLEVENDFPFQDLGLPGTPERNQDHAALSQRGLVQDFSWNVKSNHQLRLSYWWNETDREIQPVMGSAGIDTQRDRNHRAVLDYFIFGQSSTLNFKAGGVFDQQEFNSNLNETDQYFLSADWEKTFSEKFTLKTGARYSRAEGRLSTYTESENRFEAYQSLLFNPGQTLSLSANFRELSYSDGSLPFVPSFGLDWVMHQDNRSQLTLKSSLGRGYKIPTLNDRFWDPGGNPDLNPERSNNAELGFLYSREGDIAFKASTTYYHMLVDDWIIWLPQGSFWSPENIRKVRNQGVEFDFGLDGEVGEFHWEFSGAYNWAKVVALEDFGDEAAGSDRQLPYTPQHQANASLRVERGKVFSYFQGFYTGQRSISTSSSQILLGYQLFNFGLGHKGISIGSVSIPLSFQINNLFNTDYQVLYLRAMPGISYQLNTSITL